MGPEGGARSRGLLGVGVIVDQEGVEGAGCFGVVAFVGFELSLGEDGLGDEGAGWVLCPQKLVLGRGGLKGFCVVEKAALFGLEDGDGEDACGGVRIARGGEVDGAEGVDGAGVHGAGAGGWGFGGEGVAEVLGALPGGDGGAGGCGARGRGEGGDREAGEGQKGGAGWARRLHG